jgi:hypothetical protein
MNDLQTQRQRHFSESSALAIELTKMLALVAPSSMTAEQQEMWLRAAVDALDGIRPDEVAAISAEVRRSVVRHNQIVPEIAKLVAARRDARARTPTYAPLPESRPRPPSPALDTDEIRRMPKWLKDMGLRVGFLKRDGDRLVDAGR